ncbi:MAG: hypothetical protein GX638_08375 [Crenarchaeota archaeon]|nr:hypothetical protein [Thermoproteota archaeon]
MDAQTQIGAIINSDGTITGSSNLSQNGNVYTFTGNISGVLQILKAGIVVDGAGFALIGDGSGKAIDFSVNSDDSSIGSANGITIKNLIITNFTYAIYISNTESNLFYGNTIIGCATSFWISGESNNDILYNTIQDNTDGISLNFATGNNTVSHNNLINSDITILRSTQPIVNKNYWNNYLTKYPNAQEIGNSGVGNTAYVYDEINNFTDNSPLMQEISISNIEFPTITSSPTQTISASATVSLPSTYTQVPLDQMIIGYALAAAALLGVGLFLVMILKAIKKRKIPPN